MQALSPTDSAFLWLETRSQPMHVAGLNIYTPPKGEDQHVHRFLTAWRKHVSAHPPFNLRPVLKLGLWYWEEDQEFELDYHLRHVALPQPGRIRELLAMVSNLHGNLLDRNRPLWEAHVIEGLPGGRFATYIKMHHALIDGISGARLMARSMSTDPCESMPPVWAQPAARRRKVEQNAAGSTTEKLLGALSAATRVGSQVLPGIGAGLWDMLQGLQADTTMARAFQAPPTPFNVEISGSRRFAAQSYSLTRLKTLGAAAGATINDVTLAICAGALRQYLITHDKLPKAPLVAMVPVSLHDETTDGGNQVSLLLASLCTHIADPAKRLQGIVESTKAAKERLASMPRLQKLAHGMTTIAPLGPSMLTGSARKYPVFNVVISNVPGPKETLYLNGARLDEVYPVSIPTHYLALNITISGYGDHLGFGFIACRRSVPSLQRLLDYTDASIQELEAALLTPKRATRPATTRKPAIKASSPATPRKRGKAPAP
ncbi:WS/DGAT/MGAT family O-acyltransferase [Rhodoferax sp.]|uniref:WS/DGAT/MGAT family O-acyltransferase n=1 Tax=Rhodoferax sp. TaxID=50421 RepID=UPI002752DC2B|nr:wax ester/triacylglycerol synthase family O-acyltransferase [Rhodoferax sp.]